MHLRWTDYPALILSDSDNEAFEEFTLAVLPCVKSRLKYSCMGLGFLTTNVSAKTGKRNSFFMQLENSEER